MFTLQAFKSDTLASDITDSASSMTLSTGAFGTPSGEQMLVIDYDNASKREIVKCTIDGTAVTSMDRAQDGTAAVAHTSGANIIMAHVPSHYNYIATAVNNGWIDTLESWTCSSDNVITVPADATTKYSVGDKLKLTDDGTVIYAYVVAVAATTLTVLCNTASGTETTLASGSTITSPYYSKAETPTGHPIWFSWTPSYNGTGSMTFTSVSTHLARYRIVNKNCEVMVIARGTTGGSASNNLTVSKPINHLVIPGGYYTGINFCENGGAFETGVSFIIVSSATNVIYCARTAYGNYTLSANTGLNVHITYPIA